MCKYCEGEYPKDILKFKAGQMCGDAITMYIGVTPELKELTVVADIGGSSFSTWGETKKIIYCPMCGRKL